MFNNWTITHAITLIPSLIVFVLVSMGLRIWLKKYGEKIRMIPIHVVAFFLVLLELIKQIKSIIEGYDLAKLPLYYCSLFVGLFLATSLYYGKHKDCVRLLTITSGFTLLAIMLVMPSIVYSGDAIKNMFNDFDDFHTVVYHNLVLLGTILMMTLNFCKINFKKDYLVLTIFYTTYCVVAAPFANLLEENYNNFFKNNVNFVENFRLWLIDIFGHGIGQSIYVLLAIVTTVGFSLIIYTLIIFVKTIIDKHVHKESVENLVVNEDKHTHYNNEM